MLKLCEICHQNLKDPRYKTCSWVCRNKRISLLYKGRKFTEEHKANIRKNHHNVSGSKNPRWKGGVRSDGHGYLWEYAPTHPYNVQGYIRQHRLIIEKSIGRYLQAGEVVHHIDENKQNNKIENLRLLKSQAEHAQIHAPTKTKWSVVICLQCSKKFSKRHNQLSITKKNFCTRRCYFEYIK